MKLAALANHRPEQRLAGLQRSIRNPANECDLVNVDQLMSLYVRYCSMHALTSLLLNSVFVKKSVRWLRMWTMHMWMHHL